MQITDIGTLRDLVLHHAARRGWQTQRQVAVICGLDESALSRFLNGEQDLGARRTHALFQAVGIPVDEYDLAYALLARAQDSARTLRAGRRSAEPAVTTVRTAPSGRGTPIMTAPRSMTVPLRPAIGPADHDVPASLVAALFQERQYTGEQIAAFFAA
jgi:transcriptional regulator with XRE-family HTH domain